MKFFKIFILFLVTTLSGNLPVHASPQKEKPHFWVNKIRNPDRLLLTSSDIQKMNEENLRKPDLLLCNVRDMKEEWTREDILAFLKEDWKGFGKSDQVRYGKRGTPLDDFFWNVLRENIHQEGLKDKNKLSFALTVKRTDIRVFPTEEFSTRTPASDDFDLFQHSAIAPASPVGIYHFSRDRLWAYAQTSFIRGWIRTKDLAMGQDKNHVFVQADIIEPLVVTASFVRVFADPLFQKPLFDAQMGSAFQIFHLPTPSPQVGEGRVASTRNRGEGARSKTLEKPFGVRNSYVIKVPFREADDRLILGNGYLLAEEDAHIGYLPYTQNHLARQAFKMLHQPYGWGEMSGGRDCSRFIMDIFNSFGILMPRNSYLQAKMGISLGRLEGKSVAEKKKILDRAVPLATLLRMPGHIMLYLGKHEGKYYAIHSIWGIQTGGKSGLKYQKIGKVAVTDLDLGKEGPNGSLLQRLTEIQFIGPESEIKN